MMRQLAGRVTALVTLVALGAPLAPAGAAPPPAPRIVVRSTAPAIAVTVASSALSDASATVAVPGDSRPLTPAERRTFLGLVCRSHYTANGVTHCVDRIGYTVQSRPSDDLRLTAILYGPLTRDGAKQAYVTYQSEWEPHATNFGGGILFEAGSNGWRFSKWYPGGQMDHCLRLPAAGRERFLCWSAYAGMGMFSQYVVVRHVLPSAADQRIFSAEDSRAVFGNPLCANDASSSDGRLWMYVDPAHRAHDGGFAEANATYAMADDVKAACAQNDLRHLRTQNTTVRFVLNGGMVKVVE